MVSFDFHVVVPNQCLSHGPGDLAPSSNASHQRPSWRSLTCCKPLPLLSNCFSIVRDELLYPLMVWNQRSALDIGKVFFTRGAAYHFDPPQGGNAILDFLVFLSPCIFFNQKCVLPPHPWWNRCCEGVGLSQWDAETWALLSLGVFFPIAFLLSWINFWDFAEMSSMHFWRSRN